MGDVDTDIPLTPFPRLPPPPADPGEYLTSFQCMFGPGSIDAKGQLRFTVTVDLTDKYLAMPITDIRGRAFRLVVYAEKGRVPLVAEGKLKVYTAQERVKERRRDRQWRETRREWFEGSRG